MTLDELLVRQGGVLSRSQALDCGMSARTVARRVSSGTWRVLFPGVYRVAGHRPSHESRVRAASLWGGPPATVSGPAAAFWHGMLDAAPGIVGLTVPRDRHRRPRPGVVLHRRDLADDDRRTVRGVAVTAPAVAVLETAPALGARFLDRALQRHVPFADLHAAYCRRLGARGQGPVTPLLVACADRADSAAERLVVRLLRDGGLTGWTRALPFGPWTVDVAFPAERLAIEVDGWAWHVDEERFLADRRKGNALVGAGWTVLRFTWADLTEDPAGSLDRICREVRRAA